MQNIFSFVKNSLSLSLRGFEKSEVIHSIYNFFKNWIATPLLRSARNDNYFYSSLRGIGNAEAIYSIVDCFITFAHAVRLTLCALATAMTIKNNLVKSFLTSITFDSLSRKIKNPCLVINKFIYKGGNYLMNNFNKIFTYMVVGALVMALSISCKSNEEPTDNTHSNHPPAGTYQTVYGSITITATVTVSGGACNIKGTAYKNGDTSGSDNKQYDITITKWYSNDGSTDSGNVSLGGNYTSGEATVAAPTGYTSFTVQYYNGNTINVGFQVDGTWYSTYDMTRQ